MTASETCTRLAADATLGLGSLRREATWVLAAWSRCRATTFSAISRTRQAWSSSAVMMQGSASSSHAHNSPLAAQTRIQ